jgi:hypothetical protein
MKNNEKDDDKHKYTANELSEERTLLAFIRTVAIFCGIFVLLERDSKKYIFPKVLLLFLIMILCYRLLNIKYTAHMNYIRILGGTLIICMLILIYIK